MKKMILCALVVLASLCVSAQQWDTINAANASCVSGACVWVDVGITDQYAAIQVSGTFVATLQIEATADLTNYVSLSSVTVAGLSQVTIAGYKRIRVRGSAYTSGAAKVVISKSQGTYTNAAYPGVSSNGSGLDSGLLRVGTVQSVSYPNTNGGTLVGSPTFAAAKFSNGAGVGSGSNYISLPNTLYSTFSGTTASWTVEAWVKTTTSSTQVAFGSVAANGIWFGVDGASGKMIVGININPSVPGGSYLADTGGAASINDGAWHHLAVVMLNGTTVKMFVDGVLGRTLTGTYTPTASTLYSLLDFRVDPGNYAWSGQVDEVAIWTGAKYTAAFTPATSAYAGTEANLVALYHFDGDAKDSVATTSGGWATTVDPTKGITDVHIAPRLAAAFNGGGSPLTAATACTVAPSSGSIKSITLMTDGSVGNASVDISSETFAQFLASTSPTSMTGGNPVTFSSARGITSTSVSGTITAGNVYCFSLTSPSVITGLSVYVAY